MKDAQAPMSRRTFLSAAALAGLAFPTLGPAVAGEVQIEEVKAGTSVAPVIGDLVGIRFKGSFNGIVFDDIFETKEPYFYRVGSESILQGIDEVVQKMTLGQVVNATIPPEKAFGNKGRRASPGKPSIPANSTVFYTIELSTIPGKEIELLEGVDDADLQ